MLSADKSGRTHNPYDDFAKQDYRKMVMAICYCLLTSCCKYTKNSTMWKNFLTYLTH